MTKNKAKQIITVFLTFILMFSVANAFNPDSLYSSQENRSLAQKPVFTIDGSFDEQFENYETDQFPFRNALISIKAGIRRVTGSIENNDVYFGKDQYLIQAYQSTSQSIIDANCSYINAFSESIRKPINVMVVPNAAYALSSELPYGAWNLDENAILADIAQQLQKQQMIPMDTLIDSEATYFHTDHHWNEKGAYLGYEAISQTVLKKEPQLFSYKQVSNSFKGTMYSRSGAFWVKPDPIMNMIPQNNVNVSVTIDDGDALSSLYDSNKLNEKDQYQYYLSGNHGFIDIKTSVNNEKTAIIIKDSMANILIPYLVTEYQEIKVVDLRYTHDAVSAMIDSANSTDIYVIYGIDTFGSDTSLKNLH